MRFTPGSVSGVWVIDLDPVDDHRGFFARAWCETEFGDAGLKASWRQSNIQHSPIVGTLRGIHYQREPHAEVKLVRCTSGAVFDVSIDLRPKSPTYRQWFGVELRSDSRNAVWVPEGCAHGYVTLEPGAEVFYLTSNEYVPSAVGAIRHDDPAFGVRWPVAVTLVPPGYEEWPFYDGNHQVRGGEG